MVKQITSYRAYCGTASLSGTSAWSAG